MTYAVHSIFKTIQGEGVHAGRVAVFCRFTGCNLWSGLERDRATAVCRFCDTDFVGGIRYRSADELADAVLAVWGDGKQGRMVVLTGGEPALQYDQLLRDALKARRFFIAIETNGTVELGAGVDWLCLSPKAGTQLLQTEADELKVVYPQIGLDPESIDINAGVRSIQPMDGESRSENTALAIEYCLSHPAWKLSTQIHKFVGVP